MATSVTKYCLILFVHMCSLCHTFDGDCVNHFTGLPQSDVNFFCIALYCTVLSNVSETKEGLVCKWKNQKYGYNSRTINATAMKDKLKQEI